jgi:hypothetical protein
MYDSLVKLMENIRLEKESSEHDQFAHLISSGREIYNTNKQEVFHYIVVFMTVYANI